MSETTQATDAAAMPENDDVVRALVGNHRAFLGFLEARVGNRALAEDILQDAFVRGLDKLGSLDQAESATAWFYRILRNAVIDHRRRRAAGDRKLEAFAAELEQSFDASRDVRDAVCGCVTELARTLKPEYAEALRQVEIEGSTVKDYAEQAGITAGNAAVRVHRAREALRKQVARSCGSCAEHGCLDCDCKTAGAQAGLSS